MPPSPQQPYTAAVVRNSSELRDVLTAAAAAGATGTLRVTLVEDAVLDMGGEQIAFSGQVLATGQTHDRRHITRLETS